MNSKAGQLTLPFSYKFFLLNPNFLLAHSYRYLEGTDIRQMTPRGYPTFNSYVENLRALHSKWTDR